MRGDLTLSRIKERRTSRRGRAIEPLVRESLARLLPDGILPAAPATGGYWTRDTDVDLPAAAYPKSSTEMCPDRAPRKSAASKIAPAEATPTVRVRPVSTRVTASTASGALTA